MKRVIRVAPTRVIRFVDGFGKRRIFIKGIGSFLENEVVIDNSFQKKLPEFLSRYYS